MMGEGSGAPCLSIDEVDAFVGGRDVPRVRERVQRHIEACAECRRFVADALESTPGFILEPTPRPAPVVGDAVASARIVRAVRDVGGVAAYEAILAPGGRVMLVVEAPRPLPPLERQHWLDEARADQARRGPALARVLDIGEDHGRAFVVYESPGGVLLSDRLGAGTLARGDALRVAADVAAALAWLHDHGRVHGALAPDVVWMTANGRGVVYGQGAARRRGHLREAITPDLDALRALLTSASRPLTAELEGVRFATAREAVRWAEVRLYGVLGAFTRESRASIPPSPSMHALADVLRAAEGGSVLVTGPPRSGKSALLKDGLLRQLRERGPILVLSVPRGAPHPLRALAEELVRLDPPWCVARRQLEVGVWAEALATSPERVARHLAELAARRACAAWVLVEGADRGAASETARLWAALTALGERAGVHVAAEIDSERHRVAAVSSWARALVARAVDVDPRGARV